MQWSHGPTSLSSQGLGRDPEGWSGQLHMLQAISTINYFALTPPFLTGCRQPFPYKIVEELPVRTKPLARRTLPRV
jgi:hypothetical protein